MTSRMPNKNLLHGLRKVISPLRLSFTVCKMLVTTPQPPNLTWVWQGLLLRLRFE